MGLREVKGAVHVHSRYSDGSGTVGEILDAAAAAHLDFVVITDHDSMEAAADRDFVRRGGVLPVAGAEISPGGRGHCLALGADDVTGYRWMPERFFLHKLHRDGADTYIAHPEGRVKRKFGINLRQWHAWDAEKFTGLEIWSYMHDWIDKVGYFNLPALYRAPDDAIDGPDERVLGLWDRLNVHRRVVGIGALDAHAVKMLGGLVVAFPYEFLFRTVLTHVLVEDWDGRPAEDERRLREGLRQGRAFVAYHTVAAADGFRFHESGGLQMGARAPLDGGRTLLVRAPKRADFTLVHNARRTARKSGEAAEFHAGEAGVYRVEARIGGRPWIFSNPICFDDD